MTDTDNPLRTFSAAVPRATCSDRPVTPDPAPCPLLSAAEGISLYRGDARQLSSVSSLCVCGYQALRLFASSPEEDGLLRDL